MDKKLLVGFELSIDINLNLFNNRDINMRLLNKVRSFSQEHFDVKHTIYVENDKIQIFCTTEIIEVPLKSRGRDEISNDLVKAVQEKYNSMFFKEEYRFIKFEVKPMYFTFMGGCFFIYKFGKLVEATELSNTDLWYEYYGKFQWEVDNCFFNSRKKSS